MASFDASCRTLLIGSALSVALGGCSTVGPVSIVRGRTPYNEVIQATSEQQTLLNLVRAHDGETPLFVDVTEVDALTSAQAGITGGPSGIGTPGTGGALSVAGQYQEAPTVRYQPLLGAALVAQVSTPVNAESLVNLYNSGWPLGSIFDLTVTRFTPGFDDYHGALDALMTLDRYGALVLEAKAPDKPAAASKGVIMVTPGAAPKGDPALIIYFQPSRLRARFRPCDRGEPAQLVEDETEQTPSVDRVARKLWTRVQDLLGQRGDRLLLTVKSVSEPQGGTPKEAPPKLQTRSALGVLKNAAEGDNLVTFDTGERVKEIIANTRAADRIPDNGDVTAKCHASFYRAGDFAHRTRDLQDYNNRSFTDLDGAKTQELSRDQRRHETEFGNDRRLILVQQTTEQPVDAFVSIFHKNRWYSIQDDDLISKRNLALVAQINTIQAVAPQTPPLTPTIVVGGR